MHLITSVSMLMCEACVLEHTPLASLAPWGHLGGLLGHLGPSWKHFEAFGSILGHLGHLGASWSHLRAIIEPTGAHKSSNLGLCWGYVGAMLGLCWGYVGAMLGMLGLCWAMLGILMHLGASWSPILGLSWPMLGYLGAG